MNSRLLGLLAAALMAGSAHASLVTLDFETPPSFQSIGSFYGPNITFGGDALAIQNDALGPYFSNAPSPIGVLAPVGPDATMNVGLGFTGSASFFYSANAASSVGVWSGMNGSGTLLGTFSLANNTGMCTDPAFCNWSLASVAFGGVAHSITFGDAAGMGFDNVSVNVVPLPAAGWLLAMGLGGFGFAARRRRKA
jgi:hypothetical protein